MAGTKIKAPPIPIIAARYPTKRPIIIGERLANNVLGRDAKIHGLILFKYYGHLLNFLKLGFLFSLNASLPSLASSLI